MKVLDLGLKDYNEVLQMQEQLFSLLLQAKKEKIKDKPEWLLVCEHPSVITMGRRAKESNILADSNYLGGKDIKVYQIGRGGDVTYHGPGQIILYPIIDLESHKLGVKSYISLLEEIVIELLELYGIKGERIEGATGVWIGKGTEKERKISAIGVKCSHFCTMHGVALNVNCDLSGFNLINPCGFQDKGVTSMEKELGKPLEINKLKKELETLFSKHLLQPHTPFQGNS